MPAAAAGAHSTGTRSTAAESTATAAAKSDGAGSAAEAAPADCRQPAATRDCAAQSACSRNGAGRGRNRGNGSPHTAAAGSIVESVAVVERRIRPVHITDVERTEISESIGAEESAAVRHIGVHAEPGIKGPLAHSRHSHGVVAHARIAGVAGSFGRGDVGFGDVLVAPRAPAIEFIGGFRIEALGFELCAAERNLMPFADTQILIARLKLRFSLVDFQRRRIAYRVEAIQTALRE